CTVVLSRVFVCNVPSLLVRRSLLREPLLRSCVLSRRSATPSHRACFACATLALVLTLTPYLSLSLPRTTLAFVCALAKHTTHTRFDSSFILERLRRVSHSGFE